MTTSTVPYTGPTVPLAAHAGAFAALYDAARTVRTSIAAEDREHPDLAVLDFVTQMLGAALPADPTLPPHDDFAYAPSPHWEPVATFLSEWVETDEQALARGLPFDELGCGGCGQAVAGHFVEGEYHEDRPTFSAVLVVTAIPDGTRHYLCEDCGGPVTGPDELAV